MKVTLVKNNRYWDPKTETHLTRTDKTREFSKEEIEELDMSNIEYAIEVGILETDSEEFATENEEGNEENEKENEASTEEEEGVQNCAAITSSGEQCSNTAVWPEGEEKYCHIDAHKKEHEDYEKLTEDNDVKEFDGFDEDEKESFDI